MKKYLKIKNICKEFGTFNLGPISLDLDNSDYLVLLGPTGSGKTSLLKLIAGHNYVSNGQILLNNDDITRVPAYKRRVAYVTQHVDLFPHLSVYQNIKFGLDYLKINKNEKTSRIEKYLEIFKLKHLAERSVKNLSGEEKKRTALARSLIVEPALLLLDEPLGMLDHNGRQEMIEVLKMIHNKLSITTIHVTHDRHEAWAISDQGAVIDAGKIIQHADVNHIFRRPVNTDVAHFLGAVNIFPAKYGDGKIILDWIIIETRKEIDDKANIIIRPECIRVNTNDLNGRISGELVGLRDFGEYFEVEVRINEKVRLIAHCNINQVKGLTLKDKVFLDWDDDDMVFVE